MAAYSGQQYYYQGGGDRVQPVEMLPMESSIPVAPPVAAPLYPEQYQQPMGGAAPHAIPAQVVLLPSAQSGGIDAVMPPYQGMTNGGATSAPGTIFLYTQAGTLLSRMPGYHPPMVVPPEVYSHAGVGQSAQRPEDKPPLVNIHPPMALPTIYEHKVENKDTLMGLSLRYGISIDAIKRLNNLLSEKDLHAKAFVGIPPSNEYVHGGVFKPTGVIMKPPNGKVSKRGVAMQYFKLQTKSSLDEAKYYMGSNGNNMEEAVKEYHEDLHWEKSMSQKELDEKMKKCVQRYTPKKNKKKSSSCF